ncbi:MAG: histidine kinase dimerization/phosphoacceptor domain -containing protein [Ekhidna sp.]
MKKPISCLVILLSFVLNINLFAYPPQEENSYSGELESAKKVITSSTDSALYFLQRAQILIGSSQERQIEINALYGVYYVTIAEYDSAIYLYRKNAELALDISSEEAYADAMLGMGVTQSAQGKLAQSQENLLKALTYYEENGLSEKQADAYVHIGELLLKSKDLQGTKNLKEAKEFFKKALETNPGVHYRALSRLAVAYENENSLDSAYTIYQRLSKVYKESEDLRSLFSTYINMAIVYEKQGKSDSMIYYYNNAALLAKKLNYVKGLAGVYHNLVRAHFMMSNFSESEAYLDSAYATATKSKNLEVFTKLKGDEAYIAQVLGNYKKAAFLYEEFFILKDSLYAQKQAEVVQELNIKYETAANKQRIVELQLAQKDAALSLATSKNQRNLFISGFVLLLVAAGFLYYQYRTKKKTTEILSIKNEQISAALAEREILLKEIHHRVKNNLQVISSLLYLQAESLADEAAIDAVRQGQHRVEAMGLIHQRLYSADDVRGVNIQEYFEQLCEEIISVFADEESELDYRVETNNLKLDIDTVIPLGLIVNELITNAIKYAFPEKEEGLIVIKVHQEEGKLHIQVKDDGVGMTEDALKKVNSFGWKMMRSLSRKLEAKIKIKNDSGTTVELIASRYKLVK